jgi:hypothetical protein
MSILGGNPRGGLSMTELYGLTVGGPDPLEAAWGVIRESVFMSRYEQLLALARQLQLARPGQSIALPLKARCRTL